MSIDRGEIDRISKLARLEIDADELDALARECREILHHFEALGEVDEGEPTRRREFGPDRAPPRRDTVGSDALERRPAESAPAWMDGFFILPRLPALDAESGVADDEAT